MSARVPARPRPRARDIARLAAVVLLFTAAPTAGDIGSCGQSPDDLDALKFFEAKKAIDCARCDECGTSSFACGRACDGLAPETTAFLRGCYPVVHDGEVCLHALEAASCDDYAGFMADEAPTVPTECNFCPPEAAK